MKKIIISSVLVFFLIAGVSYIVNRPSVTFGAVASLPSSATQNTERATVNDLLNLTANFSTTTTNTFTNAQTFSAGWVISATSTGTNGIAITGGCFSLNGACLSSGGGASTTLLSDANTWSNAGTTTYSGNVSIVGNLKVAGNVFAPVTLVSSGNAQINGTLLVTGQTTLATTLTGAVSAASGVLSAGTLALGNGGTGATSCATTGGVWYYTGTIFACGGAGFSFASAGTLLTVTNATTTNVTVSQSLYATDASNTSRRVTGLHAVAFTLSTTTVWTGTSSAATQFGDGGTTLSPISGVITSAFCQTNVGTLGVLFSSLGVSVYLKASTTPNVNVISLPIARAAPLTIVGGTPSASPTTTPCTLIAQEN